MEGKFWIGTREDNGEAFLFDAKHLVKHVAAMGSTGSGKTVLCKTFIEEAISKGIPVIAIDPQGDLVRLGMRGNSEVLEEKGIPKEKVDQYFDNLSLAIFTPGSNDGIKIIIDPLISFPHSSDSIKATEVEKILGKVASTILGLFTTGDDPKKQHLLYKALEFFYNSNERIPSLQVFFKRLKQIEDQLEISQSIMKSFQPLLSDLEIILEGPRKILFRDGIPLDLDLLLEKKHGKTPLNIFYLSSLPDEQMKQYFISFLSNQIYSYMLRKGKGNFIYYIDEIKIFLPPGMKKTLSKDALLMLLDQARKYEISCIVATQSPGKIDYQGLSQCNTKGFGRLTEARDLEKIRDSVPDRIRENLPTLTTGDFYLFDSEGEFTRINTRWLFSDHGPPISQFNLRELISEEVLRYYQNFLSTAHKDELTVEDLEIKAEIETLESEFIFDPRKSREDKVPEDLGGKFQIDLEIDETDTVALFNLFTIFEIYVMDKKSGLPIYHQGTGMLEIDESIVTGLLQAMKVFMDEIKAVQKVKGDYKFRTMDHGSVSSGFHIAFCEGDDVLICLFLDKKPFIRDIRKRLKKITYAFEKCYESDLISFMGDISPFRDASILFEKYLGISYLYPILIESQKLASSSLSSVEERIIEFMKKRDAEDFRRVAGIQAEEIHRYLLDEDMTIAPREILQSIIQLAKKGIIYPSFGKIYSKEMSAECEDSTTSQISSKGVMEDTNSAQSQKLTITEMETQEAEDVPEDLRDDLLGVTDVDESSFDRIIKDIITKIDPSEARSLPDDMVREILQREIVYTPKVKISMRSRKYFEGTKEEIARVISKFIQSGYEIVKEDKNALNGILLTLKHPDREEQVFMTLNELAGGSIFLLLFIFKSLGS